MNKTLIFTALLCSIWLANCKPEDTQLDPQCEIEIVDLSYIPYAPTPYQLPSLPAAYPNMEIPADNPLTVQGVELGRYLFYEKHLSGNSTQACASCHHLNKAFTDGNAVSVGIDGIAGTRSAPSLINIGFAQISTRDHNFMWDGAFKTLEDQALAPVTNPIEMHNTWENAECFLRADTMYQRMFREAFGISQNIEITRFLAARALAQFERTLISFNSKYDQVKIPPYQLGVDFTESEEDGYIMFFNDFNSPNFDPSLPDAQCLHCHNTVLLTNNGFFNNGQNYAPTGTEFPDKGLGAVTGRTSDNGFFRATSLRNIALTAPYMHDGKFATLANVLDHYVDHVQYAPNLDPNLDPNTPTAFPTVKDLTEAQKQDMINFLHTLTDTSYFDKPEWRNPFE